MSKYDIYKIKKGRRTYHKCNKILFDSKPEALHYVYFMEHPNIEVIDTHKTFELLPTFTYESFAKQTYEIIKKKTIKKQQTYDLKKPNMRTYKSLKYTPDFIIELTPTQKLLNIFKKKNKRLKPIAIEVKGLARKDYMIRKKLFIAQYNHVYDFLELRGTVGIEDCRRIFDDFIL